MRISEAITAAHAESTRTVYASPGAVGALVLRPRCHAAARGPGADLRLPHRTRRRRPLGRHHRPGLRRHRLPPPHARPERPGPHRRRPAGPPRPAPHHRHRAPPPGPTAGYRRHPPDRHHHRPQHRAWCPRRRADPARLRLARCAAPSSPPSPSPTWSPNPVGCCCTSAAPRPTSTATARSSPSSTASTPLTDPIAALDTWLRHRGTEPGPTVHQPAQRVVTSEPISGEAISICSATAPGLPACPPTGSPRTPCAPATPPAPLLPASRWTGSPRQTRHKRLVHPHRALHPPRSSPGTHPQPRPRSVARSRQPRDLSGRGSTSPGVEQSVAPT